MIRDDLLLYYERELRFIRKMAAGICALLRSPSGAEVPKLRKPTR